MKLTFLGTGSFFVDGDNYHTNSILEDDDSYFLIDCGSDIRRSIVAAKKDPNKIDSAFVSHSHNDHASGLEWLAFYSFFVSKIKPKLYTTQRSVLVDMLSHPLCCVESKEVDIDYYFDIKEVSGTKNGKNDYTFKWKDATIKVIDMPHMRIKGTHDHSERIIPSAGLFISTNGLSTFITTDTFINYSNAAKELDGFSSYDIDRILNYYENAYLIFHDCETLSLKGIPASGVHSSYEDLVKMPNKIKSKTWLVHYQDIGKNMPDAEEDGFAGFVKPRQEFSL